LKVQSIEIDFNQQIKNLERTVDDLRIEL
jgi:hypothetical protein